MGSSSRPQIVTAEFNSHLGHPLPRPASSVATRTPPSMRVWRMTPVARITPVPRPSEPRAVVEITELVRSNRLFRQLAGALRLTDEEARDLLRDAMRDAGTHAGKLSAEELWFMLPRIESDVIQKFVEQDASVRREQLGELLRRVRYESLNGMKRRASDSYARLA